MCEKKTQTKYVDHMSLSEKNAKCLGSVLNTIDSIRGCTNACESCYAKRNAARRKIFEIPVLVKTLEGKPKDDVWYRVGNSGDPSFNWKHSEKLIKEKGIKNVFCVTKLQSLKGFTGYFNKLQVSVDPLNKEHFVKTLENVETILHEHPLVKIMLRIRSVSTTDQDILVLMDLAVKFANTHNLPVLETRMRFNKKFDSIIDYSLVKEDYSWTGSTCKPVFGKRFLVGAKKYYDCNLYGRDCANCANCTLPWTNEQFKKKGEFISSNKTTSTYLNLKEVA